MKKQSCICISCQNPHLLIQAVNRHRKSKHLDGHESLTKYLENLKAGEKFDEQSEKSSYTYRKYKRVVESYTKKDGTAGEHKRLTRVDTTNLSRTYVRNCWRPVMPLSNTEHT